MNENNTTNNDINNDINDINDNAAFFAFVKKWAEEEFPSFYHEDGEGYVTSQDPPIVEGAMVYVNGQWRGHGSSTKYWVKKEGNRIMLHEVFWNEDKFVRYIQ